MDQSRADDRGARAVRPTAGRAHPSFAPSAVALAKQAVDAAGDEPAEAALKVELAEFRDALSAPGATPLIEACLSTLVQRRQHELVLGSLLDDLNRARE